MHFDLDADQRALRDGIRELCRGRFSMERARAGFDRSGWAELAAAGVFGLRVAEPDGGLGLGFAHAAVVFEELGRALVPGPLVASHLAAGLAGGAASGERVVGIVDAGCAPALVEYLEALDDLLVLRDGSIHRVDPGALDTVPVARPLDPLTPIHRVVTLPEGAAVAGDARRLRLEGAVLTAALQLGIALETTERAVAHAKQREQFGRPIGSFQAVKHLCADMLVRAEVARAAVYAAAVHLDDPGVGDTGRAAAGAKLLADDAAVRNGKDCIQVHGGMGFAWEVDAHLYLKRAVLLATCFGARRVHAEAVAATL